MRKLILFAAAALVVSAAFVESASAKTRPIGFVASGQLEKACGKAGGDFMHTGGGYYTCMKECKSSSGESGHICRVDCSSKDKTCEGTTPDRTTGGTIQQILRGGTYSAARNPTTMINNAGTFTQPTPQSRMINTSGSFARQPASSPLINGAGNFAQPTPQNRMINTSGSFAQQPASNPLINGAGTFQSRPPATVGVPTSGTPNFAMPRAASQPTLNMQRR